jgi:dTMP kinase
LFKKESKCVVGKFIVLEGIDGAGGETQSKLLLKCLADKGMKVEFFSYPNPNSPVGKLIYEFLNKKFELDVQVQFLLYTTDFLLDKEKILSALKDNKVVISDRYFTSTLAYQCTKGFPLEKGLELAKLLELPVPDLVILLDIPAEISLKRKLKEKSKLDRHEEDKLYLENVRETFKKLVRGKLFAKEWVIVDATRSIEEVFAEIRTIVEKHLSD